jgi:hypothetical protein
MWRAEHAAHTVREMSREFSSVNLKRRHSSEGMYVRKNIIEMEVYEIWIQNET